MATEQKIFARNFSHSDLPVRDVLHRWVKSPLETDAGQEFELLPRLPFPEAMHERLR
jgi:hypothetical protein